MSLNWIVRNALVLNQAAAWWSLSIEHVTEHPSCNVAICDSVSRDDCCDECYASCLKLCNHVTDRLKLSLLSL